VLKQKKCRHCKEPFRPWSSTHIACSHNCAIQVVKASREKRERKANAKQKLNLKTKKQWLVEAQKAFNAFIRTRDKGRACISCDKADDGSHQRHASHFRSVGACSALRFNTFNVHASCAECNGVKSGNLIEYRIRLKKKLDVCRVEWLEGQNGIVRYDIDYAKRVKRIFKKRAAIYKKMRE